MGVTGQATANVVTAAKNCGNKTLLGDILFITAPDYPSGKDQNGKICLSVLPPGRTCILPEMLSQRGNHEVTNGDR
jgi:hypothetical protein